MAALAVARGPAARFTEAHRVAARLWRVDGRQPLPGRLGVPDRIGRGARLRLLGAAPAHGIAGKRRAQLRREQLRLRLMRDLRLVDVGREPFDSQHELLHLVEHGGRIEVGARADLVVLDTASPRTAGTGAGTGTAVFAAVAEDVRRVMVDGRWHDAGTIRSEVGRELATAIDRMHA